MTFVDPSTFGTPVNGSVVDHRWGDAVQGIFAGTSQSTSGCIFLQPDSNTRNAIQIQAPSPGWTYDDPGGTGIYGTGQAIILYKYGSGTPANQILFRVDGGTGGIGNAGGAHFDLNLTGQSSTANQNVWIDNSSAPAAAVGLVITQKAGQTGALIMCDNQSGVAGLSVVADKRIDVNGGPALAIYNDGGTLIGYLGSGTTPPFNVRFDLVSQSTSEINMVLRAVTNQVGDVIQFQSSGGGRLMSICLSTVFGGGGSSTSLALWNDAGTTSVGWLASGTSVPFSTRLNLVSQSTSENPVIIRGAVGQTANLLTCQSSTPAALALVTATGIIQANVGFRTNVITSGALSTATPTLGTGAQLIATRDVFATYTAASTTGTTVTVALSPDNVTYTNATGAIAVNSTTGTIALSFFVPAGWYVKVSSGGTLTTSTITYY